MTDLVSVRGNINEMAEFTLAMLKKTFEGFMQHDVEILAGVLKDEQRLNDLERANTLSLIGIAKDKITDVEKQNIMLLSQIVADLEEIGDYIKDMIERIEIKIEEKLLFSEDALSDYRHLYSAVEATLSDAVNSLKMKDKNFAKRVLCDGEHVDVLVGKYRQAHTQRLISGVCDPRAGNMFLNLLDFGGQIFQHTKSIANNVLELR